VSSFSKVFRKTVLTLGSAISNAGVVTVSELVGTSHCSMLAYGLKPVQWTQLRSDDIEFGIYFDTHDRWEQMLARDTYWLSIMMD
jgi:hypothetical protein